jgi:hypothetical protein
MSTVIADGARRSAAVTANNTDRFTWTVRQAVQDPTGHRASGRFGDDESPTPRLIAVEAFATVVDGHEE